MLQRARGPAVQRRSFLEEISTGSGCDEPTDFFHVAIDLPGFGHTKAALQPRRRSGDPIATADFLSEVIKSLGKHYAFCVIAAAEGASAVFSALLAQPNLASFLVMREPAARDVESLHCVFQPTLLAIESRSKRAAEARLMAESLMHGAVQEFSKARTPRYLDREIAHDIQTFLAGRRWRGQLAGFGHSKRRPLLTRLVGGMRMWKGERNFKQEQEAAKQAAAEEAAAAAAAAAALASAEAEAEAEAEKAEAAVAAVTAVTASKGEKVQFAPEVTGQA